jgi:hypothetical protein
MNNIGNLKFINLMNNNKNLTKFIITFKKDKKHEGQLINFHHKINDALYKYSSNIHQMNKFITNFDEIIVEDQKYFNIYIDLCGNELTKKQIEKIELNIDEINYNVHQVLDYEDLTEISIFRMIKYPYLSDVLLVILKVIHTTTEIEPIILQSEIVKTNPELCNTELLKEISETVSYFNKKKNDK